MTYVKICGITDVTQALHALEAGADMLGFVFAPSRRQVQVEVAARIICRAREVFPPRQRPWQAVGVFANQPLGLVKTISARSHLDVVQLSGTEPPWYCRQINVPVFKTVHVPELVGDKAAPGSEASADLRSTSAEQLLRSLRACTGASRLVLDSGGAGRWGGTGQPFAWEWIGNAARDCLVAGGLTPENVETAILMLHPWAVDVSSGVEIGGQKDPLLISRFIMKVRRSDDRATS